MRARRRDDETTHGIRRNERAEEKEAHVYFERAEHGHEGHHERGQEPVHDVQDEQLPKAPAAVEGADAVEETSHAAGAACRPGMLYPVGTENTRLG